MNGGFSAIIYSMSVALYFTLFVIAFATNSWVTTGANATSIPTVGPLSNISTPFFNSFGACGQFRCND